MRTKEDIIESQKNEIAIKYGFIDWKSFYQEYAMKDSFRLISALNYVAQNAMDIYAEEYHQSELLKLNKSDVISTVCNHRFVRTTKNYKPAKKCVECGYLLQTDANHVLNDGFIIDFFELMFLAESVIPERPIARSMCFDDFSERHYHKMNDNQRLQFFEHVQKCHGFTLENEQCSHFFARFNPKNQYLVSCFHNGKAETIQCYIFDEEYRISMYRFVNRYYIKKVVRMHDSQTII